jgi:hypothetical protein
MPTVAGGNAGDATTWKVLYRRVGAARMIAAPQGCLARMEPRAMPRAFAFLLVAVALTSCGCRNTREFAGPQLFGAPSARVQQDRAQQFDPFPDTNVGPNVGGGRPDSYTAPAPEPARGHLNQWSPPGYGR